VLGAFFLSSSDGLDRELIGSGPSGGQAYVTAKGLTPVNIATLGELLGAGTYDEILGQSGAEHYEAESAESGVWDVPADVCRALLAHESLEQVAEQWVATEELRLDGWRADDGISVLTHLYRLLDERQDGQQLWYWWSL
jgi:hypothetical protein